MDIGRDAFGVPVGYIDLRVCARIAVLIDFPFLVPETS